MLIILHLLCVLMLLCSGEFEQQRTWNCTVLQHLHIIVDHAFTRWGWKQSKLAIKTGIAVKHVLPNPVKKSYRNQKGIKSYQKACLNLYLYIYIYSFLLVHNSCISRYRDHIKVCSRFNTGAENIDMFSEERGLKKLLEDRDGFCSS